MILFKVGNESMDCPAPLLGILQGVTVVAQSALALCVSKLSLTEEQLF